MVGLLETSRGASTSRRVLIRAVVLVSVVLLVLAAPAGVLAEQVNPEIDLSVIKVASADEVRPGDAITYELTVGNAGPFAAAAVFVVDSLPAGVTLVAADAACAMVGGLLECNAGVLFADDVVTFLVEVTVDADATGDLVNQASVENREAEDSAPVDANPDNDSSTAISTVVDDSGVIGDTVFRDVDGDGAEDAGEPGIPGARVTRSGPDGTEEAITDADGRYLFEDLPPGDHEVTVDVTSVDDDLTPTTPTTVDVGLSPGEEYLDADFGLQPADEPGEPEPVVDLELIKEVTPGLASVGDVAVFTITVTNRGPSGATGVEVVDVLPDGVVFVSAAGDGSYDSVSGLWSVGALAVGATRSLDLTVTALEPGRAVNAAEVTFADQPDVDSAPGDGAGDDWDDASLDIVEIAASAQIGDTVYRDDDGDGREDVGEPGVPGITIELVDGSGSVVATQVTNADGRYLFSALEPGDYTVRVVTSSLGSELGLTTPGSVGVALADAQRFLDADFGVAEILPATGAPIGGVAMLGLLLAVLGACSLAVGRRSATTP